MPLKLVNSPKLLTETPVAIPELLTTKVPENQRGLLNGLASQLLHEVMVDMQYEGLE